MENNYLAHYGILGMRWGVRRYQNKDGSLTSLGRKRAGIKSESPRHKPTNAKKLAKQRAANLEKARQARAAKKEHEEAKKNALAKGTAKEVLKFKGELTNKELQDAYNRINTEQLISALASKETKTVWDKIGSITDKVGKIRDFTDKGINAWNTFAKIHNTFADDNNKVPVIGESKDKTSKYEDLLRKGSIKDILDASAAGKLTQKELEIATKRIGSEEALKKYLKDKDKTDSKESETATKSPTKKSKLDYDTAIRFANAHDVDDKKLPDYEKIYTVVRDPKRQSAILSGKNVDIGKYIKDLSNSERQEFNYRHSLLKELKSKSGHSFIDDAIPKFSSLDSKTVRDLIALAELEEDRLKDD